VQPSATTTVPTVAGTALPRFESSEGDPAVGLQAPAVDGSDFDGRPVAIEPDGRPKVAIFLAHWCPHCQREVRVIQRWLDERGTPDGVDLVSVVTSIDPARPNYPPDAWLDRERWSVPIVDPDHQVADAYGLDAFPYFVLIDGQGRVVGRTTGELPVETLDQMIAQLAAT
jgi:cytochrome c biogenesis protein CcmG, thiol:disulfide interchange protein DsbE